MPRWFRTNRHLRPPNLDLTEPLRVGTGFVLAMQRTARGEPLPDQMVFEEAAGLLPVSLMRDGELVVGAQLLAPEPLSRGAEVPPAQAAACLSLAPEDVRTAHHAPQVLSVGLPFLVVELASRDALRRAKPSRPAYDALLPLDGATSVYAYTQESVDMPECAIHARMFTPRMTEDPATGSATAATAALLAELDRCADGEHVLQFSQGVDMGRPSRLTARLIKRAGTATSVYVGGRCVTIMQGTLRLP